MKQKQFWKYCSVSESGFSDACRPTLDTNKYDELAASCKHWRAFIYCLCSYSLELDGRAF
eukprot:13152060-Heterocapsa_arctica.AAC.1